MFLSALACRYILNGAEFLTSQWAFYVNIDVVQTMEVGIVMRLHVKGAVHRWIQLFLT